MAKLEKKTLEDYRKLAAHHYKKMAEMGHKLTAAGLNKYLIEVAPAYRPAYFRRLKNAIYYDQKEKKYYDAANAALSVKNPTPLEEMKPKQKRAKAVSDRDHKKLMDCLGEQKDHLTMAYVVICRHLGCRPAEVENIVVDEAAGTVWIPSAKKRADRGLDRELLISRRDLLPKLQQAIDLVKASKEANKVSVVQARLKAAVHRLFPQRKMHISLYSYRHQLGADLKASKLPLTEIAAIMGHRSSVSCFVYGDRRSARVPRDYMRASPATVAQVMDKPPHVDRPKKGSKGNR